jgi:hypothetical protein
MENLLNCKGKRFKAVIEGTTVGGRIQVENNDVYLCQNIKDGSNCENKLGYKYSWCVRDGGKSSLLFANVTDIQLIDSPPSEYKDWQVGDKLRNGYGDAAEVIFRSGELVVLKNSKGRASVNYTVDELFERGFRLIVEEEDLVELTLEDVAKLKGVSVDRIRIKE